MHHPTQQDFLFPHYFADGLPIVKDGDDILCEYTGILRTYMNTGFICNEIEFRSPPALKGQFFYPRDWMAENLIKLQLHHQDAATPVEGMAKLNTSLNTWSILRVDPLGGLENAPPPRPTLWQLLFR